MALTKAEYYQSSEGQRHMVHMSPWQVWSGSGTGNAPTKLPINTIGFDQDAIGASILHNYNAATDTWTATTQTFDGFIGL